MNAIYVQSLPSRAQDLDKPITPPPGDEDPSTKKRQWRVSVRVNDHPATPTVIEDPFVEADYTTVFEHYLRSSNGSLWGLQSLVPAGDAFDGLSSAEDRIEAYDSRAAFRILLVIARDFSRTGFERDPEPDLAQWPLMKLQDRLGSRLTLEIVRPGSLDELERHLELRAEQKILFNLVHFDLHGRIMRDDNTGFSVPQTQLEKAEDAARVLARFQIENAVLNACLSAYNRSGPTTNLAHIFLRRGVSNVSAMWFYVHWRTAATYVDAFYDMLLVKCVEFHTAAQRAREALRQQPTAITGRIHQDFFLCVNYARVVDNRTTTSSSSSSSTSWFRQLSPCRSARSQESAMSTSTSTSTSTSDCFPRALLDRPAAVGDSSIIARGYEPTIRLQLHLLELEYKLLTFKVIYASDLNKEDSHLDATMDMMVDMWLKTNLIGEVRYYKAKDFARRGILSRNACVSPREKRTRASNRASPQRWLSKSTAGSLRQTLHVVREVDAVVAPGFQTDELENLRHEKRRLLAQDGLQKFADKLRQEGHSCLIMLGSQNAQWWRTYLEHLDGEWWPDMPWGSCELHDRCGRTGSVGGVPATGPVGKHLTWGRDGNV
ncbi:hypothetical protein UVI_02008480 [Ustilaginoidea virens]|uniref:CHAT domain-containing protein n=1 Tax=Ustilaginoidea virens TaxID=1159556 RepID=A0A1B5L8D8_USTVR|nr:hypothetical protein UVI_02008480 [Ustilaginoidea virens]